MLQGATERGIGRVVERKARCESNVRTGRWHGLRGTEKGLEVEQSPGEERAQVDWKRCAGATDSPVEQGPVVEQWLRKRPEGSSVKGRNGRKRVQQLMTTGGQGSW